MQRLIAPGGLYNVARDYCMRVQYLYLSPYLESCSNCKLEVSCYAYTDLASFREAAVQV